MKPDYFKFCPRCGGRLEWKREWRHEPLRLICARCRFVLYENPSPTVEALIVRNDHVLLVKRAYKPRRGYWDIPGGFMEAGEQPHRAIVREVREELGVRFIPEHVLPPYGDRYQWQGRRIWTVNLAFVGSYRGRLKISSDVAGYFWFPLDRLPKTMAFSHQPRTLRDLKKLLKIP